MWKAALSASGQKKGRKRREGGREREKEKEESGEGERPRKTLLKFIPLWPNRLPKRWKGGLFRMIQQGRL